MEASPGGVDSMITARVGLSHNGGSKNTKEYVEEKLRNLFI